MIDMHSKYDNMHKNGLLYALIYINSQIIICEYGMLSQLTVCLPLGAHFTTIAQWGYIFSVYFL